MSNNPRRAPKDRNLLWVGRGASSLLAISFGALLVAVSVLFGDRSTEFVPLSLPLLAGLASLIPGRVRTFLIPLFLAGAADLVYLSFGFADLFAVISIVTALGLLFQAWHAFAFRNHH